VAPGKAADILILDQNPLSDIAATRQIHGVVLKGEYFDRTALDEMLKNAQEQAAKTKGA
jgi:imidazolonepropionase-like amidohydrolase